MRECAEAVHVWCMSLPYIQFNDGTTPFQSLCHTVCLPLSFASCLPSSSAITLENAMARCAEWSILTFADDLLLLVDQLLSTVCNALQSVAATLPSAGEGVGADARTSEIVYDTAEGNCEKGITWRVQQWTWIACVYNLYVNVAIFHIVYANIHVWAHAH